MHAKVLKKTTPRPPPEYSQRYLKLNKNSNIFYAHYDQEKRRGPNSYNWKLYWGTLTKALVEQCPKYWGTHADWFNSLELCFLNFYWPSNTLPDRCQPSSPLGETRNFPGCMLSVCCPWYNVVVTRADVRQWWFAHQETLGVCLYEAGREEALNLARRHSA